MPSPDHAARLDEIARGAMLKYGLQPDWPREALAELARLRSNGKTGARDLRSLLWSSIDNDESRDLDHFANQVLSAMRKQFGGHAEKPVG